MGHERLPLLRGLLASLVCTAAACAPAPPADPRPNVVLISIDTLRPDHLGCYGYERPTSPTLDAIAAEGVRFADVSSVAPWTLPAHASLMTGLYPSRHGVKNVEHRLGPDTPTLATRLAAEGYATAAVVNAQLVSAIHGFDQGFESFEYVEEWGQPRTRIADSGGEVTRRAILQIERRDTRPFFLFVHNYDPHTDLSPEPAYREQFVRPYTGGIDGSTRQLREIVGAKLRLQPPDLRHLLDLYDAEIRQVDDAVGALLAVLEAEGLAGRTHVIVTSDHGEEYGEHGSFLHGRTHFQEVIAIPLLWRGPGVPAGVRVDTPVSLVDVAPTLLGQLGLAPPAGLDGRDLAPLWRAPDAPGAVRALFSEADHNNAEPDLRRMVREGRYKLIHDRALDAAALYDLLTDPGEQRDLRATQATRAETLETRLREFLAGEKAGQRARELSADERERLRALGYSP